MTVCLCVEEAENQLSAGMEMRGRKGAGGGIRSGGMRGEGGIRRRGEKGNKIGVRGGGAGSESA